MTDKKQKHEMKAEWLHAERFPRASKYELQWLLGNEMGPNPLWLAESLVEKLPLEPGMRVLDMGCGTALTSIFLAREWETRVWANDLWVSADDNWKRIREAGQQDSICPLRAEAHALPYAREFFDAIVSFDSYQYYGTDVTYLGYITRFLRTGGKLGIVVPALMQELDEEGPEHLTRPQGEAGRVFWDHEDCWTFKTVEWWQRHFRRGGLVDVEVAENIDEGWKLWRDWELIRDGGGMTGFPSDAAALDADGGRYMGFVMLVATKRPRPEQPFDHSLNIRL